MTTACSGGGWFVPEHDWGKWTVSSRAIIVHWAKEREGVENFQRRECKNCGYTEEEIL